METLEILEKINGMYANAFSQLITITILIISFGGVVLPILLQLFQNYSLGKERKMLTSQITEDVSAQIEREMREKFEQEKKELRSSLEQETCALKAGIFALRAEAKFDKGAYVESAKDSIQAARMALLGNDEQLAQRNIRRCIDNLLPKIEKKDFDNDYKNELDNAIYELKKMLEDRNANGRYTDLIEEFTESRNQAKTRRLSKD